VKWSERADTDLTPNRLTETVRALRASGRPIIDLTISNPTHAEFDYPGDLLATLADRRALTYDPHPLGLKAAREAVAADYARRGLSIASDRIVLAASTSEAYSLLFKLLCDPGDEVLAPHPSYPLFEHLARLDAVVHRAYQLEYLPPAWAIDFDSIERAWSNRTKAVLAVSPNNPTGSFVTRDELARLAVLASDHGAALIVDEVFADYELTPGRAAAGGRVIDERHALAFSLGGLSKSIGLPQAKLAWIAAAGPDSIVDAAIARLEVVCDTYLSVSTPVQIAAADLLARGAALRTQIQERIRHNYQHLIGRVDDATSCTVLQADGGWYAVVRVPSLGSEEDLVVSLLARDGVLTHPGYFFDFPSESYLVISLIVREAVFTEGVARLLRHFDCTVAQL
jgi:alanine-synthesizing transaminase